MKIKLSTFIKAGIIILFLLVGTFCYLKYIQPIVDALIEDAQDVPGE